MAAYQKIDQFYIDKWKTSLESEIRQVIAVGEAVKVFQDETEGMWFGSVIKNKGGKVISSQPPTCAGVDYTNKVNKLLASPPKKRTNSSQTSAQPIQHPSVDNAAAQTRMKPTPLNHLLDLPMELHRPIEILEQRTQMVMAPFCQQVEEAFRKQNAFNKTFNARIGHLEETTDGIDKKIDILLESLTPTARKAQRTAENALQCRRLLHH